ncbi:MAG: hypothetical protein CL946_10430 [Ectothiorhodospiraceae bacterium]|nr:hypothetical protein [Ectothiorhodospiraceae bacterium]
MRAAVGRISLQTIALAVLLAFGPQALADTVYPGANVLLRDSLHLVKGKRIGLVCNHSSLLKDGTHLLNALQEHPDVTVTAVLSPEHGFSGTASAGEHIGDTTAKSLPVYSLYGNTRKPTPEMLANIDVLVFDIQDLGLRFYTYISTLGLCMEAAAAHSIPIVVLDRPNPLRGDILQGPVLDLSTKSFVGMYPIPIRYGLTIGELASMIAGEGWVAGTDSLALHVVPMDGWVRAMWYEQTNLKWVPPSPNIPDLETALVYAGTCLIEGTNISEGRGTAMPFRLIGAPFFDMDDIIQRFKKPKLEGVLVSLDRFTPIANPGAASPKHENQECIGVKIAVTNRDEFNPVVLGLLLTSAFHEFDAASVRFTSHFDYLLGLPDGKRYVAADHRVYYWLRVWAQDLAEFSRKRQAYILYM